MKNLPATNSGLQNWRFSTPQTHLWLIKHWFYASTFVVKIATFANASSRYNLIKFLLDICAIGLHWDYLDLENVNSLGKSDLQFLIRLRIFLSNFRST